MKIRPHAHTNAPNATPRKLVGFALFREVVIKDVSAKKD